MTYHRVIKKKVVIFVLFSKKLVRLENKRK